ncbi:hypothetical protein [Ideonella livida]|uniref:Sulfotransferase n=1 Tax=Ideonella livida TaxID=2707176 RepID=A0A7C9TGJ1_9BURK|nr:hypothetical protein [Ideonella livida]NDY89741.1 hypothetical protein [Ideonella livida]
MQMLFAGGIPCVGSFPDFEEDRAALPMSPEFLGACAGRAVKVLDPHRVGLPDDCRVIWLDRDVREQAKSTAKFLCLMTGTVIDREGRRKLERSLPEERRKAMRVIGGRPVLVLSFERLLASPTESARAIGAFIGSPVFDAERAASVVLPRAARCRQGMDMERALLRGGSFKEV